MSKISIVADDTCVTVDGVGKTFELGGFPSDVHAVHFDTVTSSGHVEYKDISKDNEEITSFSDYQTYVDVWNTEKTVEEKQQEEYAKTEAEELAKQEQEEAERIANMTYVDRREFLYSAMGNQFEMIYDDQVNGTTIWKDSIDAIKARIPKDWTPENYDPNNPL